MKHSALALVCLVWLVMARAGEDEFTLLSQSGEGYASVTPDRPLRFPDAHAPRPDHRLGWWYLTANLTDDRGRPWAVHWTLFRQSLSPTGPVEGWSSRQVWMAHAAITGPDRHVYAERFARGGIGQAGVSRAGSERFEAWLDDWHWAGESDAPVPGELTFTVGERRVALTLSADTPWVKQGRDGYSRKSADGRASYYYSQPHIRVTGRLTTEQGSLTLSGHGWYDREWSSQLLSPEQIGWDWLALHLNDGNALMVYRVRQTRGDLWLGGTWIDARGNATPLDAGAIRLKVLDEHTLTDADGLEHTVPLVWSLSLPERGRQWVIKPRVREAWLSTAFPYWEGPIQAEGDVGGIGFMELTGY